LVAGWDKNGWTLTGDQIRHWVAAREVRLAQDAIGLGDRLADTPVIVPPPG